MGTKGEIIELIALLITVSFIYFFCLIFPNLWIKIKKAYVTWLFKTRMKIIKRKVEKYGNLSYKPNSIREAGHFVLKLPSKLFHKKNKYFDNEPDEDDFHDDEPFQ